MSRAVVIRAVLLDAGATLIHPDPPVETVYAREFTADGARFEEEDFRRALSRSWEEVHSNPEKNRYGGVRGESDFWRGFLNRVRSHLDGGVVSSSAFEKLASHFRSAGAWAVYDDVVVTLEELTRLGFTLGIVSNWDSYLPNLLASLGLDRFFPVIAVSAIEETGKPHPEIFRRACRRLDVRPAEALHVGDSVAEDLEGARSAGLSALLLDRQNLHVEIADRITSLAELPDRLCYPPGA